MRLSINLRNKSGLTEVLVLERPADYGVLSQFYRRFHKDILRVQLKNIFLKQLNIHVYRTPLQYFDSRCF